MPIDNNTDILYLKFSRYNITYFQYIWSSISKYAVRLVEQMTNLPKNSKLL